MKKIFEKHETLFCILLIVVYILVNSYCIQNFGTEDYRSTIINTIFSIGLIILMILLRQVFYIMKFVINITLKLVRIHIIVFFLMMNKK